MKVLYLVNKNTYKTKMSRVRFHGMQAIEKITNFVWSGPGWDNYDSTKSVEENIHRIYGSSDKPDIVVAYKPLLLKEFNKVSVPTCIRFNEMYDKRATMSEIMAAKPNLVICHHDNDRKEYEELFKNFNLFPIKFVTIRHCAEKSVFKDYGLEKKYDILLVGALGVNSSLGQHYPLRDRMAKLLKKLPSKVKWSIYRHPGYSHSDAHTDKYLIDFAKAINSARMCITCSGKPKSRFGKYVEIPACGTALVGDIPDDEPEEFRKFIIEINNEEDDYTILMRLEALLEDAHYRLFKVKVGQEFASNYTQEKYAERFVEVVKAL